MPGFAWLDTLNLLTLFNYYLIAGCIASTAVNVRRYRAIIGFLCGFPSRWPKLLLLVNKHRSVFFGWPTLLAIGLAFVLMLSNSLAIRLIWTQARVTFDQLAGHWLPLAALVLAGGGMLFFDCKALWTVGHFDRAALEANLDKAESWLKSWAAPALRIVSFGFINPRKIVGAEVQKALADANWVVIGGMWRLSLRTGTQFAVGLILWLTWAFAVVDTSTASLPHR